MTHWGALRFNRRWLYTCAVFFYVFLVSHINLTHSWWLRTIEPNFMRSVTTLSILWQHCSSLLSPVLLLTLVVSRICDTPSPIPRQIVMTYLDLQNEHFERSKYVIISDLCAQCQISIKDTHIEQRKDYLLEASEWGIYIEICLKYFVEIKFWLNLLCAHFYAESDNKSNSA
ncbi:hypothetical protein EDD85DRAFT_516974 [Armillaria nabsnona]|nr:hypothetical protein EDD85DRAFT_516974 [Armillaria nabsnona]